MSRTVRTCITQLQKADSYKFNGMDILDHVNLLCNPWCYEDAFFKISNLQLMKLNKLDCKLTTKEITKLAYQISQTINQNTKLGIFPYPVYNGILLSKLPRHELERNVCIVCIVRLQATIRLLPQPLLLLPLLT